MPARAATAVLAALLALALLAAPAAAAKKHHRAKRMYWGAWIGKQLTGESPPWDMGAADQFEAMLGKRMSLLQFASPFENCNKSPCEFYEFPTAAMQAIRDHGSIPVFSWGAEASPRDSAIQPDFQLADLIGGAYDGYIAQFAAEARDWGHPFFLRFNWEMNGDWFPWSEGVNGNQPGEYVAAWRHVHDIFGAVGAHNATWVWCPFADPKGKLRKLRSVYPGNAYVDWACLDGYNWGRSPVNAQKWRNFHSIFAKTYHQLTTRVARRKPVMLAEFATTPYGGHKGRWIKNMFRLLPRKYPRVRALVYFNTVDRGVDWPLETSAAATRAFAKGIRPKRYLENRFFDLAQSPVRPPR